MVVSCQTAGAAGPPKRVTPDENWYARRVKYSHSQWRGYIGKWYLYTPGSPEPATRKAIRTFRFTDETATTLLHKNLYDSRVDFGGSCEARTQDALFEGNWQYSVRDESQSANILPLPKEAAAGPAPGRRLFCLRDTVYLAITPLLQPNRAPAADASAPATVTPPPFGYEAFFQDGPYRWSTGNAWEGSACRLVRTFLIQEDGTLADPAGSVDMSALSPSEPRPQLTPDFESWLDGGWWHGTTIQYTFDADGQLLRWPESECEFEPPVGTREGYSWDFYPDARYSCRPAQLPPRASLPASQHADGFTLEVGGLAREERALHRIRMVFNGQGWLQRLCSDVLRCGSL